MSLFDKPENRQVVQDYLDSVAMEWKQLVEPENITTLKSQKDEN